LFIVFSVVITLSIKSVIDWYFNIYIVTNKKITEICYKPLSSRQVSGILLNQVRCTEIDTKINGIINEFLDVGDIIITFDRPTHQEEFVLTDIEDPKRIETYLENSFSSGYYQDSKILTGEENWIIKKDNENNKKWTYLEKPNLRA
jgi:hypothetical protein